MRCKRDLLTLIMAITLVLAGCDISIGGKADTPVATPDGGIVASGQEITLTTHTTGAAIYYTLNDGDSIKYSALKKPKITVSVTLKAIAVRADMTDSDVLEVSYTIAREESTGESEYKETDDNDSSGDGLDNEGTISAVTEVIFTQGCSPFHQGTGTIYSSVNDVAYGNGKFVAVGIGGQIVYSTNGVAWNAATNNGFRISDTNIQGVSYGGGKFVAFGSRQVVSGGVTTWNDIVYSSDGIRWTRADTTNFYEAVSSITYGNGKFVAVCKSGRLGYSLDGVTWSFVTDNALDGVSFSTAAYGNGRFVVVGSSGKTAYSTDGITWTVLVSGTFSSITFANNRFIVWNKETSAGSSDGLTWVPLALDSQLGGIVYGADKLVLWTRKYYMNDVATMKYSIDGGLTWREVSGISADSIRKIIYGDGLFIAVGGDQPGYIACSNKQE